MFGELVVDAALSPACRIQTCQFHAANRVANVEEAASLPALTVNGERRSDGGLHAKTVEHGAKYVVVIEAIDQRLIEGGLVGGSTVDNALIQIGGAKSPDFAGKHHVVAIVDFGKVIKGTRLFGIRKNILTAVVVDGDVTLFDIDVRSTVLTHGSKFDEMTIRKNFTHGKQDVKCTDDVVHLSKDGVLAIDHRIGGGTLFGKMNNGFRFVRLER